MAVVLPTGTTLVPGEDPAYTPQLGNRVTTFFIELLDNNDGFLMQPKGGQVGGELWWDAYASIKSGGSVAFSDLQEDIDWLNTRIRIAAVLAVPGGGDNPDGDEIGLGVYVPSVPVEEWSATGRSWKVELLDKLSVLDSDIYTDANGNPIAYALDAGMNILATVKTLIQDAGEATPAIGTGTAVLDAAQVWDAGTPRLKIINDPSTNRSSRRSSVAVTE